MQCAMKMCDAMCDGCQAGGELPRGRDPLRPPALQGEAAAVLRRLSVVIGRSLSYLWE